jgi:hypothetical protein
MRKIILEKRRDYWGAWFYGINGMPEDVEIPLTFTSLAYLMIVAKAMRDRFPNTYVFYRDTTGHVSHVAPTP